jgi:hypothetical protein
MSTTLASRLTCSLRTIRRYLDRYEEIEREVIGGNRVLLLMDTTYFGRSFGVRLFNDALSGKNLLMGVVKYETNVLYQQGIEALRQHYAIEACV